MQTDNAIFDPKTAAANPPPIGAGVTGSADDRWVFTEENPWREFHAASGLAASARVLRGYNDPLAEDCLRIAEEIWSHTDEKKVPVAPWFAHMPSPRVPLAVELLLTTRDRRYAEFLIGQRDALCANIRGEKAGKHTPRLGWMIGRVLPLIGDDAFTQAITEAVRVYRTELDGIARQTPYGVPYEPAIWGAGWQIQNFGVQQYYLHTAFPEIFPRDYLLHALNFILGCHPGSNTASFISGVGARSVTEAYGFNRADRSYLPGGSVSGTALIQPDFPELLEWPYLWQQTEYVLGGGTTDHLLLILAADALLNRP